MPDQEFWLITIEMFNGQKFTHPIDTSPAEYVLDRLRRSNSLKLVVIVFAMPISHQQYAEISKRIVHLKGN